MLTRLCAIYREPPVLAGPNIGVLIASIVLAFFLFQPLALADSRSAPLTGPVNIDNLLTQVRDASLDAYLLVAQPTVGAAWIATVRIGVHEDGVRDDGQEPRVVWTAAMATARAAFAYDVSEEQKASAAVVNRYVEEALRATLSDNDIVQQSSYFKSSEGHQYLEFQRKTDAMAGYADSRVLLEMALGRSVDRTTRTASTRADVDRRQSLINLSRSAAMARAADQLLSSSDRLANYGPAPWDAVIALITDPLASDIDPLLIQYRSELDRLAGLAPKVSAADELGPFQRARAATQNAVTRWLRSPERAGLISAISHSMDNHLSCWQALWRDGKEVLCPTFLPH